MNTELKEKYSAELTTFSCSLIDDVRKKLSEVTIGKQESQAMLNRERNIPNANSSAKTITIIGIVVALCGFFWLGNTIGIVGLIILFYGYYKSKQKSSSPIATPPMTVNVPNTNKTSMVLYTAVENAHKQCANNWRNFIEEQRLKINAEIKSLGLDEYTQMRLLDSQISNTVLKYSVMDELNILNTIERTKGSFDMYVSEFITRYSKMVNDAVSEQKKIYNKLCE